MSHEVLGNDILKGEIKKDGEPMWPVTLSLLSWLIACLTSSSERGLSRIDRSSQFLWSSPEVPWTQTT